MYRDSFQQCPACRAQFYPNESIRCSNCNGAWISEKSFGERAEAVKLDPTRDVSVMAIPTNGETKYACPVCNKPLEVVMLRGVELDRCPQKHGLWFDEGELQSVLQAISIDSQWGGTGLAGALAGLVDVDDAGDL